MRQVAIRDNIKNKDRDKKNRERELVREKIRGSLNGLHSSFD
jgi:hypothetical protein